MQECINNQEQDDVRFLITCTAKDKIRLAQQDNSTITLILNQIEVINMDAMVSDDWQYRERMDILMRQHFIPSVIHDLRLSVESIRLKFLNPFH